MLRAAYQHTRIYGVLILGVVHDSLGDHDYISRHKVVDLVLNKVDTVAFCYKINFKMSMAVLAHGTLADLLDFVVSVKVKFACFLAHISKNP
jgi:hypothetical protein